MKAVLKNKMKIIVLIMTMFYLDLEMNGQADYSFLDQTCYVTNFDGDTIQTGNLLLEDMLTDDQIDVFTYRYDSDTVITNRNGLEVPVSRKFDIYLPNDSLSFSYAGGDINALPVVVILHSGQGDKESAAPNGLSWARRGYVAVIPSYRSDRLGVDYCYIYTKSIYLAAQDISAVVRSFSFLYDDSKLPEPSINQNPLVGIPVDGESIFYSGFSYGGSAGFHAASRMIQEQWEPYLSSDEEYLVDGEDGTVELGDGGLLHSTGTAFIDDYEFPYERIKGVMSRTAAIFKPDQLNFELSPVKVPAQIICGTCDHIIPYQTRTFVNDDGLCDARVSFPDGSNDTTLTFYGPQYISDQMDEADIYHELITFCNGGHTTNPCVMDYINAAEIRFVTAILKEEVDNTVVYDEVYRYQFENYSNTCCQLGEGEYAYLDKCSCEPDNPYEPFDLPYISAQSCQFMNECDLDSLCELIPLSDDFFEQRKINSNLGLVKCETGLCLLFSSGVAEVLTFTYYSEEGKELLKAHERIQQGINTMPVPAILPRNSTIILRLEGYQSIKFFLKEL
ncbi:MAG TPA: hypothetical protein VJ949_02260 [Cryomorphaceae bacterium]|nr:hypothetical protein [Cryomorphaceae bacterium]